MDDTLMHREMQKVTTAFDDASRSMLRRIGRAFPELDLDESDARAQDMYDAL